MSDCKWQLSMVDDAFHNLCCWNELLFFLWQQTGFKVSLCFRHRICSLAITAWMADKKFNVKFLPEFDGSASMGDCEEKAVGVKPLWREACWTSLGPLSDKCFPLSQEENWNKDALFSPLSMDSFIRCINEKQHSVHILQNG